MPVFSDGTNWIVGYNGILSELRLPSLTMDTLSVTLTNTRVIDGLIFAANSVGKTPEAYAERLLTTEGHRLC